MSQPSRRSDIIFITVILLIIMVVWGIIFALGYDNGDIAGIITALVVGFIWVLIPKFRRRGQSGADQEAVAHLPEGAGHEAAGHEDENREDFERESKK